MAANEAEFNYAPRTDCSGKWSRVVVFADDDADTVLRACEAANLELVLVNGYSTSIIFLFLF